MRDSVNGKTQAGSNFLCCSSILTLTQEVSPFGACTDFPKARYMST